MRLDENRDLPTRVAVTHEVTSWTNKNWYKVTFNPAIESIVPQGIQDGKLLSLTEIFTSRGLALILVSPLEFSEL